MEYIVVGPKTKSEGNSKLLAEANLVGTFDILNLDQ